ncbi:MAG: pyruvate kinase [Myxococcaceae bacterium]|nr:pyruvate kinase [Myxococcaceae bacterium]MBH2006505.1 pyruvate kinase [Myxococcaceae bacterium]
MRRTRMMCTLGPASSSEEQIEALILAGMSVARINFSHGDQETHRAVIHRVRSVAAHLGKAVGVLQDLQGPKIRTRRMLGEGILLEAGHQTRMTTEDLLGTPERFGTQYLGLPKDVKPGDLILLDDGKIGLRCLESDGAREVLCEVVFGGILKSNKGINLPSGGLSIPSLTEKDIQDVHFGAEMGVDAVALSFVRSAEDVRLLRRELAQSKVRPLVFAKIEKPQAMNCLEEIIEESDGIMVARGDLGVELPLEQVPIAQKKIVSLCSAQGKTVVVATQMLESMISCARPTRAEASDVANAVLDGADMLMLSAETASGDYPVEAVKTMDRIIREVENSDLMPYWHTQAKLWAHSNQQHQNAASLAGTHAAQELQAKAIAIFTGSGHTAKLVSAYRPKAPIIAYVPSLNEQRRLLFTWGIESEIVKYPPDFETLLTHVNRNLQTRWGVEAGETVVLLTKVPLKPAQRTNTVHLHTVTQISD